jgi:homoserine/homoserine lactone efflux protein
MHFATWFSFFCAACLIAISPGSGAILSMSHGLSYGVKKASVTIFGLQLGLLLVFVIAGAGVGSLLLASEMAFNVVKILGATYLVYLGLSQFFSHVDATGAQATSGEPAPGVKRRIITGFLTNASNPKGIIFMVAVLPNFIDPQHPLFLQLLILGLTMVCVDSIVMHTYAFLAATLQEWMKSARAQKNQNRLFGSILVAVGLSLFLVKRDASVTV